MTFVVLVVFGMGVILIASSLDNTPVIATFGKILSGTPIDWTGASGSAATGAAAAVTPTKAA